MGATQSNQNDFLILFDFVSGNKRKNKKSLNPCLDCLVLHGLNPCDSIPTVIIICPQLSCPSCVLLLDLPAVGISDASASSLLDSSCVMSLTLIRDGGSSESLTPSPPSLALPVFSSLEALSKNPFVFAVKVMEERRISYGFSCEALIVSLFR